MRPVDWPSWFEGLHLAAALRDNAISDHLRRAARYLDEHLAEDVTLDDVARAAGYSPHHFHRLYSAAFGETPHASLTRRRLDAARDLLETTDLTVTEVCLAVGFTSLGSFSTLFHRHVGQPPSAYRRRIFALGWTGGPDPSRLVPACFLRRYGAVPA